MKRILDFRSFGPVNESALPIASLAQRVLDLDRVTSYDQDEYDEFVEQANSILNSARENYKVDVACDWDIFKSGMSNRLHQEDSWNDLFSDPEVDEEDVNVLLVDLSGIGPFDPGKVMAAIATDLEYNEDREEYQDKPVWAEYNDGTPCMELAEKIVKFKEAKDDLNYGLEDGEDYIPEDDYIPGPDDDE